jgi:hypothetical protein
VGCSRELSAYSSFPGRMFWGDGASDCGTLTIRFGLMPGLLVLPVSLWGGGVERGVWLRKVSRRAVGS